MSYATTTATIAQVADRNYSIDKTTSMNFSKYKNDLMGLDILYPDHWLAEEDKGVFDFNNTILINPSVGPILYPNYLLTEEKREIKNDTIQLTTSVNNIFDTLPVFIYNQPQTLVSNISFPSIVFFSPLENTTDMIRENVKVMPKIISTNITLNRLVDSIGSYLDYYSCDRYPSNLLEQHIGSRTSNDGLLKYDNDDNDEIRLDEYAMALTDLYKACIKSFELLESTPVKISDYPGYKIAYSFNLNSKTHNIEHVSMQIYMIKDNKISIVSYNAARESYLRYLPEVEVMINSLKLY